MERKLKILTKEERRIAELEKENLLLKEETAINKQRADFQEEVITEIIMAIMP